jgi:hypothetical protein
MREDADNKSRNVKVDFGLLIFASIGLSVILRMKKSAEIAVDRDLIERMERREENVRTEMI